MKLTEVKNRLKAIVDKSDDDEYAHIMEDDLLHDFIAAIKNGSYQSIDEVVEVATEVYKTRNIEFGRWYA